MSISIFWRLLAMRKNSFLCAHDILIPKTVLIFFGILVLLINNSAYSIENFKTLQTNTIVDQSGIIHLFGELKNISNESQYGVTAFANLHDKNGQNMGNGSGIAMVRSLNVGQVSPFEILFLNKDRSKQFFDYSLNYTSKAGHQKADNIVITSSKSRPDIFGYYYVSGRILNMGNQTATNVLAIASFFDTNGKIIGLSSAIAEPTNITSHSPASFTIVMDDKLQSSKIKNYSLIADSDQYVSK
jgi:hypothetical protein